MRNTPPTARPVGLAVLAVALALLGGWLAWWLSRGERGTGAPPAPAVPAPADEVQSAAAETDLPAGRTPRAAVADRVREAPPPAGVPAASDVTLRVVDADTRLSLAGMRLSARGPGGTTEVTTDAYGEARLGASKPFTLHHVPDAGDARFAAEWELAPWRIDPALGPRDAPVVVAATGPALVLEVHVVGVDGLAQSGATAALTYGRRDGQGDFHAQWIDEEPTDERGVARFSILAGDALRTPVRLSASTLTPRTASAALPIDPPLGRGPYVLALLPCGTVRVRAFGRDGLPLAQGHVVATEGGLATVARSVGHAPVKDGLAELPLPAGPHRLRVRAAGGDVRFAEVDVAPDATREVVVRFDDGATERAAAGTVVDEQGAPLAEALVWCTTPGIVEPLVFTGGEGRFEFWGPRSATVQLEFSSGVEPVVFEPATRSVPFGTLDVVARRVARREERRLIFEVTDVDTGAALDVGGVYVLCPPVRPEGGWRWEGIQQGRADLMVPDGPSQLWLARAEGYLDATGEVPRGEATVSVALARGFARTLRVVDASTGGAIAGARVAEPGGHVAGTTDAQGQVRLQAATWPPLLSVERAGFRDALVDPGELSLVDDTVALKPLE